MSVSRRKFFTQSGLLAGSALAFPQVGRGAEAVLARPGQKPRHIIHLVSDGMSLGTLTCADHFARATRGRGLAWTQLYGNPAAQAALVNMRSLNSLVTDSAAASSSWASGSRVKNGALNLLPDARELRPLCTLFGEAGWARGLVTTTEITHATPAGFAANVDDRGKGETIAVQYLERRIEVLLGGARDHFEAAKRKDKRDLLADFAAQGYAVCRTRAELDAAPLDQRWLGVFATGHLPFTIDHMADAKLTATVPTLPEMTRRALKRLENAPHFLLQVEGGRVDHAAHNSDAAAALREQVAFDEAIELCLEFQREQPDTLLVITTDHGNSNLGLNGMGDKYGKSSQLFAHLQRVKKSLPEILSALKRAADAPGAVEIKLADGSSTREIYSVEPRRLAEVIGDATGYKVPAHKAILFARYLLNQEQPLYDQMNSPITQLGQLLANHLGVGWTGNSHTGDYVPLVAIGPGAEHFRGFLQNTDVFHHYLALADIDFRNPEVPLLAECAPSAVEAERYQFA
jgi:alkaline phosphatase